MSIHIEFAQVLALPIFGDRYKIAAQFQSGARFVGSMGGKRTKYDVLPDAEVLESGTSLKAKADGAIGGQGVKLFQLNRPDRVIHTNNPDRFELATVFVQEWDGKRPDSIRIDTVAEKIEAGLSGVSDLHGLNGFSHRMRVSDYRYTDSKGQQVREGAIGENVRYTMSKRGHSLDGTWLGQITYHGNILTVEETYRERREPGDNAILNWHVEGHYGRITFAEKVTSRASGVVQVTSDLV